VIKRACLAKVLTDETALQGPFAQQEAKEEEETNGKSLIASQSKHTHSLGSLFLSRLCAADIE